MKESPHVLELEAVYVRALQTVDILDRLLKSLTHETASIADATREVTRALAVLTGETT